MAMKVTVQLALNSRSRSLGKNKAQKIHQRKGFQSSEKHKNKNCGRL